MEQETVLVIEGKTSSRQELKESLTTAGYRLQHLDEHAPAEPSRLRPSPHLVVAMMPLSPARREQMKQLLLHEPRPLFLYILTENMSKEASEALQLGADDILRSPFSWHDLRARVRLLSERRRRDNLGRPGVSSIGNLSQISIRELIDLFALRRGTATLELQNPPYRGRLFFKEGRLFGAILNHLFGFEAFLRLLQWEEGTFTIFPEWPSSQEPLGELQEADPLGLAFRAITEWKEILEKLPSLEQPLMVNRYRVQEAEDQLSDLSHHLLWQIASHRTLQGVLDDLDRDSLVALKELHRLYQKGFFSITTQSQAALPAFRYPVERPVERSKHSPVPFEQGDAAREIKATEMKNFDQLLADAAHEAAQLLIAAAQPVEEARRILERRDAYADVSWGMLDTLHTEGRTPSQDGPLFSTSGSFVAEEPLPVRRSPFARTRPERSPFADTHESEETRPPVRQTKPSDPFELGDFKFLPLVEEELHPSVLLREPSRPFNTLPDLPAIEPTPEELNKGALSLLTPLRDEEPLRPRVTTALVFNPSVLPKEEIEEMLPPPPLASALTPPAPAPVPSDLLPPLPIKERVIGPLPTGDIAAFSPSLALASSPSAATAPKTLPETPSVSLLSSKKPSLDFDVQALLQDESDKLVDSLLSSELSPLFLDAKSLPKDGEKTDKSEKTKKAEPRLSTTLEYPSSNAESKAEAKPESKADPSKKSYRPGTTSSASFSLESSPPKTKDSSAKLAPIAIAPPDDLPIPFEPPTLVPSSASAKPVPSRTFTGSSAPVTSATPAASAVPATPATSAIPAASALPATPIAPPASSASATQAPPAISEPGRLPPPSISSEFRAKAAAVRPPAKLGLSDEFFINDDALVRRARTRRVLSTMFMGILLLGGTFGLLYLLFPPPAPTPPYRIVDVRQPARRLAPSVPERRAPPTPTPPVLARTSPSDGGLSDAGSSTAPGLGSSNPTLPDAPRQTTGPSERREVESPPRRTEATDTRLATGPSERREVEPPSRRTEEEEPPPRRAVVPPRRTEEEEPPPRRQAVVPPRRTEEEEPPPRRVAARPPVERIEPPVRRPVERIEPPAAKGNVGKLLAQAQAMQRKNNFGGAEKILRQALKQDGGSVPVLSLLGQVLFEREKASQALIFLEKAYRINPREVKEGLMTLGSIYQERQQSAKARQMYQQYLQYNPGGRMAQDARDMIKSLTN